MPTMRPMAITAFGLACLATTAARAQVAQVQIGYDTYAAGIEVMQMQAYFGLGAWSCPLNIDYHTTGLVGLFYRGHQTNSVHGTWHDDEAIPLEFSGEGVWRGHERRTLVAYDHGVPQVKELQPPQETEREPVPPELQRHTVDTLSALAQLMRRVQKDHTCETEVHTYDGRRGWMSWRTPAAPSVWTRPAVPASVGRLCAAILRDVNSPAFCCARTMRSTAVRSAGRPGWHLCSPADRRYRSGSRSRPVGSAGRPCI